MQSQELKLDHFKIYKVSNIDVSANAWLRGQFDEEPDLARLHSLTHYCTPVSKNNEPSYDEDAHLAWYSITQQMPEPMRIVTIKNQFGTAKLILGEPFALLVPSQKQGHQFPKRLDHYKVYRVLDGEPINKGVSLNDQFENRDALIKWPVAFAVPVRKRHEGQDFQINNETAHLTMYRMTPRSIDVTRISRDQFGRYLLAFIWSMALAVPSIKDSWKVYDA